MILESKNAYVRILDVARHTINGCPIYNVYVRISETKIIDGHKYTESEKFHGTTTPDLCFYAVSPGRDYSGVKIGYTIRKNGTIKLQYIKI